MDDEGLVEELQELDDVLTPWERGFIESVSEWVGLGRPLSDRQREVANEILERH